MAQDIMHTDRTEIFDELSGKIRLRVDSLFWGADAIDIVKAASLTVRRGAFVGIIGPNGSGKSSLLKCIYRANRPRAGSVLLDNEDLLALSAKEAARRLAAVPQEMPGEFDFTVREIAAMGRYPHKRPLERVNSHDLEMVNRALAAVGLTEKADRSFRRLSGGEKQRALIARAIAQESDFLVLDEPTNHLDIYYQLEIMDLLKNLALTSLVVMHDLNHAMHYCDWLFVMQDGQIVASGSPSQVLTEDLISRIYGVESHVIDVPGTSLKNIVFLGRSKN